MSVYLRAKFEVSSIILKSPPRLGLKKKIFIFKSFLHLFSTVSSRSTLILHEVFRDYQLNLENTAF